MSKKSKEFLTIGEVVEELKLKFPDISISKIRYLEDEGLLQLERTEGGYRKFYDEDVKKLELILQLQKDNFLPLKVIKEKIREIDSKESFTKELKKVTKVRTYPPTLTTKSQKLLSLKEASRSSGLLPEEIKLLENFKLVKAGVSEKGKVYDETNLKIMRTIKEVKKYGLEPRHLRIYEAFSEREVFLLQQIFLPKLQDKDEKRKQKTLRDLTELVELLNDLKALLLKREAKNSFRF